MIVWGSGLSLRPGRPRSGHPSADSSRRRIHNNNNNNNNNNDNSNTNGNNNEYHYNNELVQYIMTIALIIVVVIMRIMLLCLGPPAAALLSPTHVFAFYGIGCLIVVLGYVCSIISRVMFLVCYVYHVIVCLLMLVLSYHASCVKTPGRPTGRPSM